MSTDLYTALIAAITAREERASRAGDRGWHWTHPDRTMADRLHERLAVVICPSCHGLPPSGAFRSGVR